MDLLISVKEIKSKSAKYITVTMEDHASTASKVLNDVGVALTEPEKKCITELKKLIIKGNLNVTNRDKIVGHITTLEAIEKKYIAKINELPKEKNVDVNKLEDELDGEIACYTKYDDCNPMQGVSWIDSKKRYIIIFKNEKGERKSLSYKENDLESACEKMKEKLIISDFSGTENKSSNFIIEEDNVKKFPFTYRNYDFVTYWYDGHFYFDIQHVVEVLELKTTQRIEKYNGFEEQISHVFFFENEYGGFIPRELILNEVAYDIILNSTSKFAKSFKSDIAKFLAKLQDSNQLILSNNELTLRKENPLDKAIKIDCYHYTDVTQYNEVLDFVKKGTTKNIVPYLEEPVLYIFIIDLPTKNHEIIIKPGYSADITTRMKSLRTEYKCDVFFLDMRFIKSERDEKRFHEAMKTKYPELIYSIIIDGNEKTELYYFHPSIINEFNQFMPKLNETVVVTDKELTDDDKELIDLFKKQNTMFINSIISKLIKTESSMLEYLKLQLRLEFDNKSDERSHLEKMKELDNESKKLDNESKRLEIKLIDKKIELEKVMKGKK